MRHASTYANGFSIESILGERKGVYQRTRRSTKAQDSERCRTVQVVQLTGKRKQAHICRNQANVFPLFPPYRRKRGLLFVYIVTDATNLSCEAEARSRSYDQADLYVSFALLLTALYSKKLLIWILLRNYNLFCVSWMIR